MKRKIAGEDFVPDYPLLKAEPYLQRWVGENCGLERVMIDWERVADLRAEVGEDDFNEVVELFLEEVEEVIARLDSSPVAAKFEEDLHFLKGSALNLGFRHFSALCQIGEKQAANGLAEQVEIAAVLASYRESKTLFLAELQAHTRSA